MPWCVKCDRSFISNASLRQHLEASSLHADDDSDEESPIFSESESDEESGSEVEKQQTFCFKCNRNFVDENSLDDHLRNSSRHNVCLCLETTAISTDEIKCVALGEDNSYCICTDTGAYWSGIPKGLYIFVQLKERITKQIEWTPKKPTLRKLGCIGTR
jgi:hypothetical protein